MITYAMSSPAFNINSYITAGLSGYLYVKGKKAPPPYDPAPLPNYDSSNPQGV